MKNFLFICSLLLAGVAFAHGDEEHKDHAHAAPSAVLETNSAVPALTTQSETFELVARLYENELGLYIDDWRSNAPVLNARVEVELDGRKATAQFHADHGDYAVADPEMLKALHAEGEHALVFSIVAGKDVDLLTGELHVHAESPAAAIVDGRSGWLLAAVALVLLIGCGLAVRQLLKARKETL
ncbi:MAG: hypothetical protein KGL40_13105 [Rhodocyclaceae bacterium]|nr:hypothetical protein [Rhodocyclaceae bacterium]